MEHNGEAFFVVININVGCPGMHSPSSNMLRVPHFAMFNSLRVRGYTNIYRLCCYSGRGWIIQLHGKTSNYSPKIHGEKIENFIFSVSFVCEFFLDVIIFLYIFTKFCFLIMHREKS